MNRHASFTFSTGQRIGQPTGRYIVTFADNRVRDGLAALRSQAGVQSLPSASEFESSAIEIEQLNSAGGAVFPTLGMAVVTLDESAVTSLAKHESSTSSAILGIEPERTFSIVAGGATLSSDYLQGFDDAYQLLKSRLGNGSSQNHSGSVSPSQASDSETETWGMRETKVVSSRFSGRGIRVAVLDTGMDLRHPDFQNRRIVHRSFIPRESVQDENSHGTHCIGTACGYHDANGRRYGVAFESEILVGKVMSNSGSGTTANILSGIEWAIASGAHVISMSLGNAVNQGSVAYETAGRRAMQKDCLIIAAAGNHREEGNFDGTEPGEVGQPANSPSILAVAAVDQNLRLAPFSCTSSKTTGGNIDIAAPGVSVYSSVPMPHRYNGTYSGTSMATPHVAGIAALYAQAFGARGAHLSQLLLARARRLDAPAVDVGAGFVQAPQ